MKVTYIAPKGDNEVVHMRGTRFIDGQPADVTDEALLAKLRGNPHFLLDDDKKAAPVKPT